MSHQLRRTRLWLVLSFLLAAVLLASAAASWLDFSKGRYHQIAQDDARSAAQMLETSITLTIRGIDTGMRAMASELAGCAQRPMRCDHDPRAVLTEHGRNFPEAQAFFFISPDGVIRHTYFTAGGYQATQVSVLDREYFVRVREDHVEGLVVSRPQIGRVTGRWSINLARGVTTIDGRFLGVVAASLDLAPLEALLAQVPVGERGAVSLRDDEMGVILRLPETEGIGKAIGVRNISAQLRELLAQGRQAGVYRAVTPIDGVERTVAFVKSQAYPLYVNVGLSAQDYLADWQQERKVVWGAVMAVLLAVAVLQGAWWSRQRAAVAEQIRRDRAQRTLRSELEKTEAILQHASDGIHILDRQGNVVEANDRFCEMLGYSRNELLGMNVSRWDRRFVSADAQQAVLRELFASSGTRTVETLHQTRSGKVLEVDVSLNAFEMGGERFLFASARDVTERNRIVASLAESEERFRTFFERNRSVMLLIDPGSGRIVSANHAAAAYYGYSLDQLQGMDISTINTLPPEEAAAARRKAVREEKTYFQFRHRLQNGEVRDVEVYATPTLQGGSELLFSIVHDVTERQRARERLQLAASVFSHAHEGIMITDPKGVIIDVNDSFTRITGYSRDEAVGQTPALLKSNRHPPEYHAAMWHDITTKGHWYGETWNRRKGGEIYVEMLNINAVKGEDGQVQCYVGLFSDITSLKEHQQRLEHIAHYDALTDLPNRVLLSDRLQRAMVHAQRHQQSMAVMFLDLDGFKQINDLYGHETGDRLLVALARRLESELREGDTLARVGGDEFVAVLTDLDRASDCNLVLERLLAAASSPVRLGELDLKVSASIGVTVYPHDASDPELLLRHADLAMYQAKQDGRNRYHVFDLAQDSAVRTHRQWVDGVRLALAHDQFVLLYQPKVNMRTGEVVGVEALIRWQHPTEGLLSPAVFIPVIEDHPVAVDVGEWVIRTALAQAQVWRKQGLELPVSVNVGGHQLQQLDFLDRLRELLQTQPELPARFLDIEILETSALEDMAHVSNVILDCRSLGVDFALDDFGTGYSSLAYLKLLPVSQLKIDQSFVRTLTVEPENRPIIDGIVGLARAFGRQVIAEGVESVQHGQLLVALGCDLAQGYGIARPMPGDQVLQWVREWPLRTDWAGLRQASDETQLGHA